MMATSILMKPRFPLSILSMNTLIFGIKLFNKRTLSFGKEVLK